VQFEKGNDGLTKHSRQIKVWACQPGSGNTDDATNDCENQDTPPPDIQTSHAEDQSAEETQVGQFDWEQDEPPEGCRRIFLLGDCGDLHEEIEYDTGLGVVEDYSKGVVQMLKSGISQSSDAAQADDGEKEQDVVNGELIENTGSDIGASDICGYGQTK